MTAATRHLGRYRFFYLAGAIWLAVALVLPSVSPQTQTPPPLAFAPTGGITPSTLPMPTTSVPTGPHTASGPTTSTSVVGATTAGLASGPTVPSTTAVTALAAAGKTRNGVVCRPGVPQVSFTAYSPPCAVAFTGNNGGATSNGVTATTIRVALLGYNSTLVNESGERPPAEDLGVLNLFTAYFNKVFELYGRKVQLVTYDSPHTSTLDLVQGEGQDDACQDAIALSQEQHVFAVYYNEYTVAEQCLAEQHVVVTEAEGRPPEPFLQQYDPYLWTEEEPCYRLADQTAEYVRKRLAGGRAIYAGDPAYRTRVRKIGIMVADNDIYKPCIDQAKAEFGAPVDEFDFVPDVSRLADQVLQAAIHFKAEGDTTVVVSDPLSTELLTDAAETEGYHPEWVVDGIGSDDEATEARQYNPSEVDGHLFGRSEYKADLAYSGPGSEAYKLYQQLTAKPFDYLNASAFFDYWYLIQLFRLLQAAGPDLTPATLGRGAVSLPEADGPIGDFSYDYGPDGQPGQIDHGATLDQNEIYWDSTKVGWDDGKGDYVVNPHRYRTGQMPSGPPDVFPS